MRRFGGSTTRVFHLSIWGLVIGWVAGVPHEVEPHVCTYGQWSDPILVEPATPVLNATRFPALPIAATSTDGASSLREFDSKPYVVGVAGYETMHAPPDSSWPATWPPHLRVLQLGGRQLEVTPGNAHWYAYPRAAMDGAVLHVIWAEPDTAVPLSRRDVPREEPRFRTLWYAQLRSGNWSQPLRIFRAMSIKWDPLNASQMVIGGGHIGVAFAAEDSTSEMLVYLRAAASPTAKWQARVWRFLGPLGYVDMAAGDSGRLAIAFVRAPEPPERGENFLFVTNSTDGGSAWSSPRRISRPTEEPAIEPHVFLRGTTVNVVWTSQPVGQFTDGVVWTANVNPDGKDIGPHPALPLSGVTNGSRVAVDACGTVHFIVRQYKPRGESIAYVRYDRKGWTAIEYPFEVRVSQPSIAVVGDVVRLVWSSVDNAAVPRATLMTATLSITPKRGHPP